MRAGEPENLVRAGLSRGRARARRAQPTSPSIHDEIVRRPESQITAAVVEPDAPARNRN